jgi:uncharacterized protein YijF (DUF1287 family)
MIAVICNLSKILACSLALAGQGDFFSAVAAKALEQTKVRVVYDPAYTKIPYPGGDVAANRGVCTDVVIRTYRALGIDLQKEVHEDMAAHFAEYPKSFGLKRPDTNIDHRRVPNLRRFFERMGASVPVTKDAADYLPGDLVTWDLGDGQQHIGIVSDKSAGFFTKRKQIVHNIGQGQVLEDVLFDWPINGHYRYRPGALSTRPGDGT